MSGSSFSLEGRTALVTGGGRGIATALAEAGADVVVADSTQEPADEGASAVAAAGRRALALQVDVRLPESVDAIMSAVGSERGRVDIAVNDAGGVSLDGSKPFPPPILMKRAWQ